MNDLDLIDLLKIQQYKSINLNLDSTYEYTHKIGFDNKQLNGLYLFNPMVKCDDPLFLTMKKHVENATQFMMEINRPFKRLDVSNLLGI
jgi:hypothetical protein